MGPRRTLLFAATAVAAPVALAVETALSSLVMPAEHSDLRALLEPALTPVAWGLVAVAVALALGGPALLRRASRRKTARLPPDAPAEVRARLAAAAFLLASSVVQMPALAATLAHLLGAAPLPVVLAVTASTAGVIAQAVDASRAGDE